MPVPPHWSVPPHWLVAVSIAAGLILAFVITVAAQGPMRDRAQLRHANSEGFTVIKITPPRTAVDLELMIERNDAGEITKIHRLVLWSDGRISFPDIPYNPRLVFACRDCPPQPNPCPEDIDGDGKITVVDLLRLNAKMGQKCPDA